MKSPCIFLQLWLFCILLMFSFLCLEEVTGQCLERHKSLLLELKRSLVIDETTFDYYGTISKLAEWNASSNCCLWPGVTCSGRYVTGLDLGKEPILGGFNESSPLFQLTSLTSLTLTEMSQETVIPSEIGKLVNLMHLNLYGSSFAGQIPIELSNLTRLVSLDLSYHYSLKVENPNLRMLVGNLSNLVDLRLSQVDLSSQSREWCQTLSSSTPRLQVLDLGWCRLSGPIHDSLGNLTNLSVVDLSGNNFSGPIPFGVFSNLKNLTSLTLRDCNFNGEFPPTMFQLPTLRHLDLSWNRRLEANPSITFRKSSLETLLLYETYFLKTIPESIGEARMLSQLDLSYCNLSGQIPKSISQLEHLVDLDMSYNNLEGHIPSFSRSKSLTVLELSDNRLNGSILATDWKMLLQLEKLSLGSNNLSGSIPKCLFEMPSLEELSLHRNHFNGFTKESNVTTSSSRLELHLDHNDLQGTFPSFVFGLRSLYYLDLSFNSFSTFPLGSFVKLPHGNNFSYFPQFTTLRLASCNLKEFPPFLANQSILYILDLSGNQIDGQVPDHIWNVSGALVLSSNKLHGSITKSFCNMLASLRVLDLSYNLFSGILLPQCLTRFKTLSVLNLRNNYFSGTIPDIFTSSIQFDTLDLSQNSFEGEIPKSLGGSRDLSVLNLGYNKLHDMFPCWLNGLDQLRVLVLRSNSLYGSIQCLNHMFNWTSLQIMDIASNEFHGDLPSKGLLLWKSMTVDMHPGYQESLGINGADITNTVLVIVKGYQRNWPKIDESFTLVDFSDNKFEGDIPHELGELKFLFALNLSHNDLSGKIPTSFGNFYRIESLDLSRNELSGKIPEQLAVLTFLEVLNLSFNHLEGMIPKGPQFQTFSEDSFKGNKGLCGQPLNTSCGNEGSVSNPPDPSSEAEAEAEEDYGYILIATQVGYTLGFGLIVMPLIFWSTWRKRYYECIDRVMMNIFCCQSKKSPPPRQINSTN